MSRRRPAGDLLTGCKPDKVAGASGELRPAERAVYDQIKAAGGYASPSKIRREFRRLGLDRDTLDPEVLAYVLTYWDETGEEATRRVLAGERNA